MMMEIAVLIVTGTPEIVRLIDNLASLSWFGFSRVLETEADLRALRMVIAAGYDPSGGAALFDRLDEIAQRRRGRTHWLDTHPGFQDRIAGLRQELARIAARGEPLRVISQHFREETDGIAVTVRRVVRLSEAVLVDIEVENTRRDAVRILTVNAALEVGSAEYGLRLRQTTFDGQVPAGSTVRSTLAFHRPPEAVRKATLSLTVLLPGDESRPLLLDVLL
ncbi:MAG: M48 family metalloprotease [Armatimonadetes bacterium]|nr:M48 family metalloprotease [Armatimonadota bacterium]